MKNILSSQLTIPLDPITQELMNLALREDLGVNHRDLTSECLFAHDQQIYSARIISKQQTPIVICGIHLVKELFSRLSTHCHIQTEYSDGAFLSPGETLLTVTSSAHALLKGERVVLNFLRHLCAVATLTAEYVKRVQGTSLKILDTRKTTPGMRQLEKHAVACGGGVNHRMGLYDAIMVKDTHIDLLGGITIALNRLPDLTPESLPVIVEVRDENELDHVLNYGLKKVNRILFDNMNPSQLAFCVRQCQGLIETEASGNIRLNTIREIAETGVDYASVGELTYHAGQVDLSMKSSATS